MPCGHCFCCAETCGSSRMTICPTCNDEEKPIQARTKLYGALKSLAGFRAMLAGMDAGDPAAGGAVNQVAFLG